MLIEKEIICWNNNCGLTKDLDEVIKLPKSEFPRLIFQDVMDQLKLPKINLGFELNTNQLIELEPISLEQIDSKSYNLLNVKNTINLADVLTYYLLTKVLHTNFLIESIYSNNHGKVSLSFLSQMPFSYQNNDKNEILIKQILNSLPVKTKQLTIERFFILTGEQFKEKLMLFLTYLDTKYKFKLNKSEFIELTLGQKNMKKVKAHINQFI